MAQFSYATSFQSLMDIAQLLSNQQFTEFLEDIVYPYRANIGRDTSGFETLPLKPAFDMTYAALQRENNIGIMATHVALGAHAVPRPTKGVTAMEGTIPHMATNITLGQEDYLRKAKLLMNAEMVGTPLVVAAQDMLFRDLSAKLAEHDDRVSYMRDYVVFNGKYEVTQSNNDGTFYDITFDFKVPSENQTKLSDQARWWTDSDYKVEGTSSDPVKDIDEEVLKLMDKGIRKENMVIEIGYKTLHRLARHSKVRESIAVFMNPNIGPRTADQTPSLAATTYGMSDEQLIAQLSARIGVDFLVRDFITSVPKLNKKTGVIEFVNQTGFSEDKLVFRPKGNIGEVHSSGHLTVGGDTGSDGRYGMYEGGKILVTYTCNTREKVQIWDTEETTLCVLTAGKNMRYLTVK